MTKNELISYARTVILKQEAVADNQKTVHFQRVGQSVSYAFDTLLGQVLNQDEIEAYFVKDYYNQEVKESSNGYRYVGISDSLVPVGDNGVWYVVPSGGGMTFSRSSRPKIFTYRGLYVGQALQETFWRIGNLATNKQIILENIGNSPFKDIREVDFGVVRSLDSYSGTEDVQIPDGRMDLLSQMVVARFYGCISE